MPSRQATPQPIDSDSNGEVDDEQLEENESKESQENVNYENPEEELPVENLSENSTLQHNEQKDDIVDDELGDKTTGNNETGNDSEKTANSTLQHNEQKDDIVDDELGDKTTGNNEIISNCMSDHSSFQLARPKLESISTARKTTRKRKTKTDENETSENSDDVKFDSLNFVKSKKDVPDGSVYVAMNDPPSVDFVNEKQLQIILLNPSTCAIAEIVSQGFSKIHSGMINGPTAFGAPSTFVYLFYGNKNCTGEPTYKCYRRLMAMVNHHLENGKAKAKAVCPIYAEKSLSKQLNCKSSGVPTEPENKRSKH